MQAIFGRGWDALVDGLGADAVWNLGFSVFSTDPTDLIGGYRAGSHATGFRFVATYVFDELEDLLNACSAVFKPRFWDGYGPQKCSGMTEIS